MSLAARRLLSKRSVTHAELPEQHTRPLEIQQADAGSNLNSDTTLRDAADLEDNRASSSRVLTNDGDDPMVIDSDEDTPSLNQESHTESTPRPKSRGKVVCQTCQRRKVKCSGQSDRLPIQHNLQCEFCAANGVECIWKLPSPKRKAPEANYRRRANTAGQAGSSQAGETGDRAQPQYRIACKECRKRKQRCTGERPACQFCAEKQQTCSYGVADGMTRTEDLKHRVQEATERGDKLVQLVCAMQRGTQEQSSILLARLRVGASVDDLLHPETDPDQFPEYIRNGPRGAHSISGSSTGPTTSPTEGETPVSTTTSPTYSFDFSMPPPRLSPADMEQANNAFKQFFPS